MSDGSPLLSVDRLWSEIQATTDRAIARGALQSIHTRHEVWEDGGIPFVVRILDSLARKEIADQRPPRADFNPFLPPDPHLLVGEILPSHLCVLNKYNVVDHHFLVVTRDFEPQTAILTLADFQALWRCLAQVEGLAFYNGGKIAGASQRHKHLQLVPFPIAPQADRFPIAMVVGQAIAPASSPPFQVPLFPFAHGLWPLAWHPDRPWSDLAQETHAAYVALLQKLHLGGPQGDPLPYNLLMTRQWIMIIPRTQETYASIAINALGFAGTFLVKDQHQLQLLKHHRPLAILRQVGRSSE